MLDKNGRNIVTGDVVRISNAYFKNDNGLYFVESSAGDPNWSGSDHSLKKICKNGRISTAKYNICFWPISVFTNDRVKRAEANTWNWEHAEIEIVDGIDRTEVAKHFKERAADLFETIRRMEWDWGKDNECVKKQKSIYNHYLDVANSILGED